MSVNKNFQKGDDEGFIIRRERLSSRTRRLSGRRQRGPPFSRGRHIPGIFLKKGFEGVGVSSVARRAGVSKILIYRYFGNFDGLLEEVGKELDPASVRGIPGIIEEGLDCGATLPEILYETVLVLREHLESDGLGNAA